MAVMALLTYSANVNKIVHDFNSIRENTVKKRYLRLVRRVDLFIDGGKVIQAFLEEDLVDELIISKAPVIIGNGIPLFGYLDRDLEFKHVRADVCSNGLVRSYYERK